MHNNTLLLPAAPPRAACPWPTLPMLPALHALPGWPPAAGSPASADEVPRTGSMVFMVDGDDTARRSLAALVDRRGWRAECFASAREFLGRPPHAGPSCLVLDVGAPGPGGLALAQRIVAERSEMPVIATTGQADVPCAVQAMKAGAMDFHAKPVCGTRLLHSIEEALARSRTVVAQAGELRRLRARYGALTGREREVMALVVRGLLNKQVGAQLAISEVTVKAHRGSAMRKMGARSLPELVRMAGRLGGEAVQIA